MTTNERRNKIIREIKDNKMTYSVDILLNLMADTGCCPVLVFDDNGSWAVTTSGMNNLRLNPEDDFSFSGFVPAEDFKPNIREAVVHYIDTFTTA